MNDESTDPYSIWVLSGWPFFHRRSKPSNIHRTKSRCGTRKFLTTPHPWHRFIQAALFTTADTHCIPYCISPCNFIFETFYFLISTWAEIINHSQDSFILRKTRFCLKVFLFWKKEFMELIIDKLIDINKNRKITIRIIPKNYYLLKNANNMNQLMKLYLCVTKYDISERTIL